MIKRAKAIIAVTLISLSGCNICPEPNYVIFDRENLTVRTESDKYFIEEIELAEYIKEEKSTTLIDSTKVLIELNGSDGSQIVNLKSLSEEYNSNRPYASMFQKKDIYIKVGIKKKKEFQENDFTDDDNINIYLDDLGPKDKKKFGSKHPCP